MTKPQINVTPLIDVLLVLLIIFMVVTPTKPSSMQTKIPSEPTKDDRVRNNPYTLIVSVAINGELRLNNAELGATVAESGPLVARLRGIFAEREVNGVTERTVFIKGPKTLDYGTIAAVVDAVRAAGSFPVSLQVDNLN